MKKTIFFAVILLISSCKAKNKEPISNEKTNSEPAKMELIKPDFSAINFASVTDSSCGMPLSAGVKDTVVLNDQVYGFCSKACKDEFVTLLKAQQKR